MAQKARYEEENLNRYRNSTQEDIEVSNRHMTCWKRARWIRIDDESSMRSTNGRRSR